MESKAQGNKLFSQGKNEEALAAYTTGIEFIEDGGEDVTEEDKGCLHLLYCNRSLINLNLRQVDEALQDSELSIEINPEYGKAYVRRANALMDLFKTKQVLDDIVKAVELDPTLASMCEETKERALGNKWVPNCYLQKRHSLQNKLGCDYVIFSEGLGDDSGGAEDYEAIFFHPEYHKKPAVNALKKPDETGTLTEVLHDFTHYVDHSKFCERLGEDKFKQMMVAQFKREYGPDKPFTWAVGDGDSGLFSSAKRSILNHGVNIARTPAAMSAAIARIFYPGGPKWVELDKDEFILNIQREIHLRPRDGRQNPGAIPQGTSSMGFPEPPDFHSFDTCKTFTIQHRKSMLETRELKCASCYKPITDPDPQECLCGTVYCNDTCACKDYEYDGTNHGHQPDCIRLLGMDPKNPQVPLGAPAPQPCMDLPQLDSLPTGTRLGIPMTMDSMRSSQNVQMKSWYFTMWYWELVWLGYYPLKDEVDWSALWKARRYTESDAFDKELQFYREHEWVHFSKEAQLCRLSANEMCPCKTGKVKELRWDLPWVEVWLRAVSRTTTFLPQDSCARILSKVRFYAHLLYPGANSLFVGFATPEVVAQEAGHFLMTYYPNDNPNARRALEGILSGR